MLQVPKYHPIFIHQLDSPLQIEQEPLILRFINYIISFFTGDWGNSEIVAYGKPVFEVLRSSVPRMIEIIIVPLVSGVILGKLLGRVSIRKNHTYSKKILNILIWVGFVTPVFWFGYLLQKQFIGILPIQEWDGTRPPLITGFLIVDSIITGDWRLLWQIIVFSILPTLFLTILITALRARHTLNTLTKPIENDSVVSNSLQTGMNFSLIFMFYVIIDISFYLRGFSYTLLNSLWIPDFTLLQGCMFMIIICFVITIFISNLIFIRKSSPYFESAQDIQVEELDDIIKHSSKEDLGQLKKYLIDKLKSPISIAGVSLVIFLMIISIFPQLITPYTISDITPPNFGGMNYTPPSQEHPLGTAYYGYDLLALVIWGIRDLLASGGWTLIIGLMGGLPFGFIASKFNRSDKQLIQFVMSMFFIFPSIVITLFMLSISRNNHSVQVFIIGILLIPMIANKIAHSESKFISILKELIIYIPCVLVFSSLLYTAVGYLGFTDSRTVQLGFIIHRAQEWYILERFRAIFWPGLAIFLLNLGLILIYQGLNSRNRESQK
jgi:ABC-type dipeptide/oligopeptide/nickel transport system permease subunit/ABC-type dipeptide/oligopeptide/nickel transport system permease component